MNSLKTPKPLLAARMAFPLAASLITVLLGEWIARGALTADTVTSFICPHAEAYLLAWLFLFLVWLLLDWIFRLPPLSTIPSISPPNRNNTLFALHKILHHLA